MTALLVAILLVLTVGLGLLVAIGMALLKELARWTAETEEKPSPLAPGSTREGLDDM